MRRPATAIANVTGQALFLLGIALTGVVAACARRLDKTLACLLAGFAAGLLLPFAQFDNGIRAHNLR